MLLFNFCKNFNSSYCPKHSWGYNTSAPKKKSVFAAVNEFKEKRLRNNVKKNSESTVKKRKKRLRKKRVKKSSKPKQSTNVVASNDNTIGENKASEYEFQSRTDFNSDEAAQDEANQEEEDEDAAAEESSEDQCDEDEGEDCEDDEESQGGSNRAYQNTDSECDSSNSIDEQFYYEKFKSKTAFAEIDNKSHDDDDDILCSNLDFKLLD